MATEAEKKQWQQVIGERLAAAKARRQQKTQEWKAAKAAKAKPVQSKGPVPKVTWEGWMRDEALVRQIRNKQGGRGSILTMEDSFKVLKRTLGGD